MTFFQKATQTPNGLSGYATFYKRTKFKSRTEARWAFFYDLIGVRYWYEPRKFDFGDYRYVPDFYLPELRAWIEIKGADPPIERVRRIERLAEVTGESAYLFFGPIDVARKTGSYAYGYEWAVEDLHGDHMFTWAECPICRRFGISIYGRANRLRCPCLPLRPFVYGDESERLVSAFKTAREAFKDGK